MARKTLKSGIDALFTVLGGPVENRPGLDAIRRKLSSFATMAEALENGEATRETEAEITALEAALKKSETELAELKKEMQTANAEIERLLADQEKREKTDQDIEPKQFEILSLLPTENRGGFMPFHEICQAVAISFDEAEIRLHNLQEQGWVVRGETFTGHVAWQRTVEGTKLVYAVCLANEEARSQKTYNHPNLAPIQHEALLLIARNPNGISESELVQRITGGEENTPSARLFLTTLRTRGFVAYGGGEGTTVFDGHYLVLAKRGEEYLAE